MNSPTAFIIGSCLSFATVFFWIIFYYSRDPHHESKRRLFFVLMLGVVSFFLSFILLTPVPLIFNVDLETIDILFYSGSIVWVFILAFSEELAKFFMLKFALFSKKDITEHTDGIVYGGLVGLGFAAIENMFYAIEIDLYSALVRALLIPLLHSATGAIFGFVLVEKKIKDVLSHQQSAITALAIATLFHGLYNYFIVITQQYIWGFTLTVLMWTGLLLAVAYVTNLSRKRDYDHTKHSIRSDLDELREAGRTFSYLGLFCGFIALMTIFPLFFALLGGALGYAGVSRGARTWGKRAIYLSISAIVVNYIVIFIGIA